MKKYLPHACVLGAGILWGLIGIFNRGLTAAGLSPLSLVAVRNIGGLVLLGLLFLCTDRSVFRIRFAESGDSSGTNRCAQNIGNACHEGNDPENPRRVGFVLLGVDCDGYIFFFHNLFLSVVLFFIIASQ